MHKFAVWRSIRKGKRQNFSCGIVLVLMAWLLFYTGYFTTLQPIPQLQLPDVSKQFSMFKAGIEKGRQFSTNVLHHFEGRRFFKGGTHKYSTKTQPNMQDMKPFCHKWAVLTTINYPTEALRRVQQLSNCCIVIVADLKTPNNFTDYYISERTVFLSISDQKEMQKHHKFMEFISWNHYGRKNIGYFYAIAHGARAIWDFDDKSLLKFFIDGAAPETFPQLFQPDKITVRQLSTNSEHVNPLPLLGSQKPGSILWPRGFPINLINNASSYEFNVDKDIHVAEVDWWKLGVIQSVADLQPDIDTIAHTMNLGNPLWFERSTETRPLVVPRNSYVPYNAQATLHHYSSFWCLLLPVTVNRKVADIWRSYFSQSLFRQFGISVGYFSRPMIVHEKGYYNTNMPDENHFYERVTELVKFLQGFSFNKSHHEPESMEMLWIALYEHGFIELNDVHMAQHWLKALAEIGFKFPAQITNESLPFNGASKTDAGMDHDSVMAAYKLQISVEKFNHGNACKNIPHLQFLSSDMHDGTRIEAPSLLSDFGHRFMLASFRLANTPFKSVFKQKPGISVMKEVSRAIVQTRLPSTPLLEQNVRENFNFYQNATKISEISKTDAFFCSFPASFCEVWMPFNKTIIFRPAHRYNYRRCTLCDWNRLDDHLHMLAKSQSPKHIISASSFYDAQYIQHYTGLKSWPLYSSSLHYATATYNPTRSEILLFCRESLSNCTKYPSDKYAPVRRLYPFYSFENLTSHKAVVYIPYAVMSYKLTELYALAIPLFVPSVKFFRTNRFGADRSILSHPYCNSPYLDDVKFAHPESVHPYSPNREAYKDLEAELYWLQFSDFDYWPHVTYFDSLEDLELKLANANFTRIHELMKKENQLWGLKVERNWCKVASLIEKNRNVPESYEMAMKMLNVSCIQC